VHRGPMLHDRDESLAPERRTPYSLGGMLEELLHWLERSEGPLAYLVLALAGSIEYLVPPFPGDTIVLFGAVLAGTAGYRLWLVFACITGGSIAGSLGTYAFGAWVGRNEERWPGFMRGKKTRERIHAVVERFERHGAAYLAINRFLPAFRAVFFVAAGMARLPIWKVVVFGGLSAAIWNAGILGLGYALGHNYERLQHVYREYTTWSLVAIGAIVLAIGARWLWRRRAH